MYYYYDSVFCNIYMRRILRECPRGCWESAEYCFPQPLGHSTYSSSGGEELEIFSKLLWRPVAYTHLHINPLPNFSANQEEIKAYSSEADIYSFEF